MERPHAHPLRKQFGKVGKAGALGWGLVVEFGRSLPGTCKIKGKPTTTKEKGGLGTPQVQALQSRGPTDPPAGAQPGETRAEQPRGGSGTAAGTGNATRRRDPPARPAAPGGRGPNGSGGGLWLQPQGYHPEAGSRHSRIHVELHFPPLAPSRWS